MTEQENTYGPDVAGFTPLRQYRDLRGYVYLRSADLKWLRWEGPAKAWNSDEIRPGRWLLVGIRDFGSGFGYPQPERAGHDPYMPVLPLTMLEKDEEVEWS